MPLLPWLPVIVWMGMINVALDVRDDEPIADVPDPDDLVTSRENIIAFPFAA